MATTHKWRVLDAILKLLIAGNKDLELRLGHDRFKAAKIGDIIIFNGRCRREIVSIREYDNYRITLLNEDSQRILPGMARDVLLRALENNLKDDVERLGVLIFELKPC